MSLAYITEYSEMPRINGQIALVGQEPNAAMQAPLTFTGTAGQSAAFNANTKFIRFHADGICSIKFGTNPTAVANTDMRLAASSTEFFGVVPGQKVSVVTST